MFGGKSRKICDILILKFVAFAVNMEILLLQIILN